MEALERIGGMDVAEKTVIAFAGPTLVARGDLREVALRSRSLIDAGDTSPILIFDEDTSEPVEVDFRGTPEDVAARIPSSLPAESSGAERRGPGRPKLGVVPREVTLLPRHWEWLNSQPGGASVTLRKLVDEARRAGAGEDRRRLARESAYRFMTAMAGDEAGYEEATRALFAGDREGFRRSVRSWPADVREHASALAERAFNADCAPDRD